MKDRFISTTVDVVIEYKDANVLAYSFRFRGESDDATGSIFASGVATTELWKDTNNHLYAGIGATMTASTSLPTTINAYDLTTEWKLQRQIGSEEQSSASERQIGTSRNRVYVTGAAAPGAFESVLELGCAAGTGNRPRNVDDTDAAGLAAERTLTDRIWSKFSGRSVKTVENVVMNYSHARDANYHELFAYHAKDMLARTDGNGQCTAWAELLVITLQAQGVDASLQNIYPPSEASRFAVKLMKAQGSGPNNYLKGTIDEGGFGFHQIVRIAAYDMRIYDPSYGSMIQREDSRSIELQYEDSFIVAFFISGSWVNDPPNSGVIQIIFSSPA